MSQWAEEITFYYTNTDGDETVHRITRDGGITLDAAYVAFDQFLRGAGYSTDESPEPTVSEFTTGDEGDYQCSSETTTTITRHRP